MKMAIHWECHLPLHPLPSLVLIVIINQQPVMMLSIRHMVIVGWKLKAIFLPHPVQMLLISHVVNIGWKLKGIYVLCPVWTLPIGHVFIVAVTHLLNTMKLKPVVTCYDWAAQSELLKWFQSWFPHVKVIKAEKSPLMKQEKAAFCKMLDHWLLQNNNNWLYGVHIIQAVTNTMPL